MKALTDNITSFLTPDIVLTGRTRNFFFKKEYQIIFESDRIAWVPEGNLFNDDGTAYKPTDKNKL